MNNSVSMFSAIIFLTFAIAIWVVFFVFVHVSHKKEVREEKEHDVIFMRSLDISIAWNSLSDEQKMESFKNCTRITSYPIGLFDSISSVISFKDVFAECKFSTEK